MRTDSRNRTFSFFYSNDGTSRKMRAIEDKLIAMKRKHTTTVEGWAVTKWSDEKYEIGTLGKPENMVCLETAVESLASSTNRI